MEHLLGLPLEEALERLRRDGVEPSVEISRAPRRSEGVGALRVVRILDGGRHVTASAFIDRIAEEESHGVDKT